jgi:acyl-coenzyme A thioesterase PaaI-like protein
LAPVTAEARVMKLGRKLVYLDVAIAPEAGGDVVAHATGTYARP